MSKVYSSDKKNNKLKKQLKEAINDGDFDTFEDKLEELDYCLPERAFKAFRNGLSDPEIQNEVYAMVLFAQENGDLNDSQERRIGDIILDVHEYLMEGEALARSSMIPHRSSYMTRSVSRHSTQPRSYIDTPVPGAFFSREDVGSYQEGFYTPVPGGLGRRPVTVDKTTPRRDYHHNGGYSAREVVRRALDFSSDEDLSR